MKDAKTSKRILIVEDDQQSLRALQAALEHHGHKVIGFENAADAVPLDVRPIDTAIIDLRLLDMPGHELAMLLKAKSPALKVIFVTGYRIESNVLGPVPGARLLMKPLNMQALLQML